MKYRVFITDNDRGDICEAYSNTIDLELSGEDATSISLDILRWNPKLTVVIQAIPEE